jgi:hypothetical protein
MLSPEFAAQFISPLRDQPTASNLLGRVPVKGKLFDESAIWPLV